MAASNLLYNINEIEITELDKISLIEKAVHDKNYSENDLFFLYKKFQFNINQLLNASESYKALSKVEARALVYQKILLESDVNKKLELIKLLKSLFVKDNYPNAFDKELKKFLEAINPKEVPSNFTTFYYNHLENDNEIQSDIKFNKDILHQSKLINYFNGDFAKSKIEKDFSPKGKTSTHFKDMNNILDCANSYNTHLPISNLVKEMYKTLVDNGHGNTDHSSLYKEIERINKK